MNLPRISYAAYGFALTIIIVDQLTKAWVLARLGTTDLALIPNGFRLLDIWPPYLRFTYLLNDGVTHHNDLISHGQRFLLGMRHHDEGDTQFSLYFF